MTEPGTAAAGFAIVRGNPTDEELAALVVVLTSQPAVDPPPSAPPTSDWASYRRAVRAPLLPGPGAWRASAREP